jgi:hypothetical protein
VWPDAAVEENILNHSTSISFHGFVSLLESKLRLLSERDQAPEYIVAAIPDDVYRRYGVVNLRDPVTGVVHRDLRRAFRAMTMKYITRLASIPVRINAPSGRE